MVKILYATAPGKRGYWKRLLIYSAFCGIAVSVMFNVSNILQKYGTQGLSAPLQSMTAFAESTVIRTVRTEIIILCIVRIISAAVTGMLMSILSGVFRNPITAYLANTSIFVLPAALALLGVSAMRYIGVNPFLRYNPLAALFQCCVCRCLQQQGENIPLQMASVRQLKYIFIYESKQVVNRLIYNLFA